VGKRKNTRKKKRVTTARASFQKKKEKEKKKKDFCFSSSLFLFYFIYFPKNNRVQNPSRPHVIFAAHLFFSFFALLILGCCAFRPSVQSLLVDGPFV
jgi:hypothetical protein